MIFEMCGDLVGNLWICRCMSWNVGEVVQLVHFLLHVGVVLIFVFAHFDQAVSLAIEKSSAVSQIGGFRAGQDVAILIIRLAFVVAVACFLFEVLFFLFFRLFLLVSKSCQRGRSSEFSSPSASCNARLAFRFFAVFELDACLRVVAEFDPVCPKFFSNSSLLALRVRQATPPFSPFGSPFSLPFAPSRASIGAPT